MQDSFHFIHNLPEDYPWYKRAIADIIFNFGRIRVPVRLKDVSKARQAILKQHKAGDVLLMGAKNHIGQWIIAGTFTHSGVISAEGKLIHALADGVEEAGLDEVLARYDHFALLRPSTEVVEEDLVEILKQQLGSPYDFEFSKPRKHLERFYCSELVYWSYKRLGLELISMKDRRVIHPSSFMKSQKLEVIYSTE